MRPNATYIDRDLDGDAMAQDGFEVGVMLMYVHPKYVWVNHGSYTNLDGDKENPLFGKKNDAQIYRFASEVQ